jgi:hypothetical protein
MPLFLHQEVAEQVLQEMAQPHPMRQLVVTEV